jgi:TonB family protein
MTSVSVESRAWSRRRWWGLVALIFVVQLSLIFWLGDTVPIRPRPAAPAFTFKLAGSASAELLALNDPTLFALPHRQGAVAPALLGTPRSEAPAFQWPEPTNSLLLAVGRLGAVFSRFIETNEFDSPQLPANLKPALTFPNLPPQAVAAEQSVLRFEWDLAPRRLITPRALRSWPNPEILTDSVVRIAVDSEGRPVSPALLSSSGSVAADQYALEQARAARFEPLRRNPADPALKPAADLSLVRMIFRWHTLPPSPTNTATASP